MAMQLSEKNFKNANKRFREFLNNNPDFSGKMSNMEGLQALSRILFDKPYEELKAKLFSEGESRPTEIQKVVALLSAGSDTIIAFDGQYISGNFEGTDLYVAPRLFHNQAEQLAATHNATLIEVDVPMFIDNWETEDVIETAMQMGVFEPKESLFDILRESKYDSILIDGRLCPHGLNDDWFGQMEEEGFEACIWFADTHDSHGGLYEYFLSAKDLMNCYSKDGKHFYIEQKECGNTLGINIKVLR